MYKFLQYAKVKNICGVSFPQGSSIPRKLLFGQVSKRTSKDDEIESRMTSKSDEYITMETTSKNYQDDESITINTTIKDEEEIRSAKKVSEDNE